MFDEQRRRPLKSSVSLLLIDINMNYNANNKSELVLKNGTWVYLEEVAVRRSHPLPLFPSVTTEECDDPASGNPPPDGRTELRLYVSQISDYFGCIKFIIMIRNYYIY